MVTRRRKKGKQSIYTWIKGNFRKIKAGGYQKIEDAKNKTLIPERKA